MGKAQGKNKLVDVLTYLLNECQISLGEGESVSQNGCQSRVPLYNGASCERLEASPDLTSRTHQNRFAIKGHQERAYLGDAHVSGKLRYLGFEVMLKWFLIFQLSFCFTQECTESKTATWKRAKSVCRSKTAATVSLVSPLIADYKRRPIKTILSSELMSFGSL